MIDDLRTAPVRRLSPADLAECVELAVDRGWPTEEDKWALLLEAGDGYGIDDPAGGLACALVITCFGADLAALGNVLVAARYDRRGLGRRMTEHALLRAGDRPVALFASDQGLPLYERLGFHVVDSVIRHNGRFRAPGHVEIPVHPATDDDVPAILRLDHEATGADRAECLRVLVVRAEAAVIADGGYAVAWRNMNSLVIGPIIARDDITARSLIHVLAAEAADPIRVDASPRRSGLITWLADAGLTADGSNPLMLYGAAHLPGNRTLVYAPITQALG